MTVSELYEKLHSPQFQDTETDMFYNFYIFQYPATDEYEIRRQIQVFKENLKRPASYVDTLTLDLFEEFCRFLDLQNFGKQNPSLLRFLMQMEAKTPDNIQKVLSQQANSQKFYEYIYERIQQHISIKDEMHVSIKSILHNYKEMRKEIATFPFVSALDDAIELLEKWQAERDHKKFFELVITDREKGKEIFDRCKSLKAFLDDQFAGYKKIRNFINDNLDNFDFLPSEDQKKGKQLYAMVADEWPVPSMKRYGLLTRELTRSLETMKKEKRNEISEKYKLVFEDLRQVCAEADVEYRINEQNVIKQMTVSDKLYVLAGNLNTSEYRAAQVQEIMERSHHVDGKPGRRTRMVTLHTGSTTPLNTEAAVDEYLAKLKLQLMEVVNSRSENDDIMVK